jgi:hypothetical protein
VVPWAFRRYVDRNELKIVHFYAAYPDHTMLTVRQAIAIAGGYKRDGRPAATQVRRVKRKLVPLVLGPAHAGRSWLGRLWLLAETQLRAVIRWYGVKPLTVILPIRPGRRDDLEQYLDELPEQDADAPMSRVTGTHFARFALLGPDLTDLGQPSPDHPGCYLLFTSNYHGPKRRYYEALYTGTAPHADRIWGECVGYSSVTDAATFRAWLDRHSYRTQYFVAGYPPRSVSAVRASLELRQDLAANIWTVPDVN